MPTALHWFCMGNSLKCKYQVIRWWSKQTKYSTAKDIYIVGMSRFPVRIGEDRSIWVESESDSESAFCPFAQSIRILQDQLSRHRGLTRLQQVQVLFSPPSQPPLLYPTNQRPEFGQALTVRLKKLPVLTGGRPTLRDHKLLLHTGCEIQFTRIQVGIKQGKHGSISGSPSLQ